MGSTFTPATLAAWMLKYALLARREVPLRRPANAFDTTGGVCLSRADTIFVGGHPLIYDVQSYVEHDMNALADARHSHSTCAALAWTRAKAPVHDRRETGSLHD